MIRKEIKLIYLDQYDKTFRLGYDSACVIQAIKDSLKLLYEHDILRALFINIHKDSLSMCQGLCAENLFFSEVKCPLGMKNELKNTDEVWLSIKPSKMIKH